MNESTDSHERTWAIPAIGIAAELAATLTLAAIISAGTFLELGDDSATGLVLSAALTLPICALLYPASIARRIILFLFLALLLVSQLPLLSWLTQRLGTRYDETIARNLWIPLISATITATFVMLCGHRWLRLSAPKFPINHYRFTVWDAILLVTLLGLLIPFIDAAWLGQYDRPSFLVGRQRVVDIEDVYYKAFLFVPLYWFSGTLSSKRRELASGSGLKTVFSGLRLSL